MDQDRSIKNKLTLTGIKCTVIVTAYNQVTTISQTLESILNQECNFKYDIVICDDHSKDGTSNLCLDYKKKFPEMIHIKYQPENLGVAANFSYAIKQSKGEYIAICAADDYWHNNSKLQMQVDFLDNHPDYGMVYTDYDKLNVINGKIKKNFLIKSKIKLYEGAGLIEAFFQGKVAALTLTVMVRKELLHKYVPLNDYIKYKFPSEDWITWLIISKYSKIGCIPLSTSTYRYGHESLSNINNYVDIEKRFNKEHFMYKYLCDLFPEDIKYDKNGYLIYANRIFLNLSYKRFDYKAAYKYSAILINLGSKRKKELLSRNRITFYMFAIMKYLKDKFIQ